VKRVTQPMNGEYIRVTSDGYLEIRQKVGKGTVSASGKSLVVVSTGGFKPVDGGDIKVNLTAIRKA
jgi:hypothetical protein